MNNALVEYASSEAINRRNRYGKVFNFLFATTSAMTGKLKAQTASCVEMFAAATYAAREWVIVDVNGRSVATSETGLKMDMRLFEDVPGGDDDDDDFESDYPGDDDDAAEMVAPTLDKPFQPYTDMSEAFNQNLPEIGKPESVTCCITLEAGLIQIKLPGPLSGELSIEGQKLSLTMDISPAHEWETLIKKAVAEGSKVNLSFSVETFVVLSDEGEAA